ncbi:MAG: HEPN domain-containing protein [bacterium]
MDDKSNPEIWLARARSNLALGKSIDVENVIIDDLCFELQQCAEKALKALLIYYGIEFPKTHDLSELLKLLINRTTIVIPDKVKEAIKLTLYATITRYPNWNKITKQKYKEALILAESVYNWVEEQIKDND